MDAKGAKVMTVKLYAEGISGDMLDILEAQGLPVRRELDVEVPPLPLDITEVDDKELMSIYTKYLQNYNFMLTQVACAELAVIEAQNNYSKAEAKALLSKTTGKSTEKSIMLKAQVLIDPEIEKLANKIAHATAYHKLLKTMQEDLERCFQLTSRELSRRNSVIKARGF
jgi:hypothetical protein